MNWSALFAYRDGLLYWNSPGPGRQLDKPAGSIRQDGYHAINVSKKKYRAHRIIWEMHHSPIPEGVVIDHIDADPGNNRIENLRLASVARNNTRSVSNSKHRWKGVQQAASGRYQAYLPLGSTNLALGVFEDAADAAVMYTFVAAERYGEFVRFNKDDQSWVEKGNEVTDCSEYNSMILGSWHPDLSHRVCRKSP